MRYPEASPPFAQDTPSPIESAHRLPRRAFLRGLAGVSALGVAGLAGLVGCAPAASTPRAPQTEPATSETVMLGSASDVAPLADPPLQAMEAPSPPPPPPPRIPIFYRPEYTMSG